MTVADRAKASRKRKQTRESDSPGGRRRDEETAQIHVQEAVESGISGPNESGLRLSRKRPETPPRVGLIIDQRYRILERLGEGGMGTVYIAEHLKLHKKVAIKLIRPDLTNDGEVTARFAREAMVGGLLDHPNIAHALDYGVLSDGTAYLVMQFVRGFSLRELLLKTHTDGLGWKRACQVGTQIADALAAAHQAGIVHRDLKPENILLEPSEQGGYRVRVLDFGIARIRSELVDEELAVEDNENAQLTKRGAVVGTLGYMAPEQATASPADHRADLYSLGVLLWEMIVGRPLFEADEVMKTLSRQLSDELPSCREASRDGSCPLELEALVRSLLEREPAKRPENALVVREQLRRFVEQEDARERGRSAPPPDAAPPERKSAPLPAAPALSEREEVRFSIANVYLKRRPPKGAFLVFLAMLAASLLLFAYGPLRSLLGPPRSLEKAKSVLSQGAAQASLPSAPSAADLPHELRHHLGLLLHSGDAEVRKGAASWLNKHSSLRRLSPATRALIAFEAARSCSAKKAALWHIHALGDPSILSAVDRMSTRHDRSCGLFGLEDCYACLSRTLPEVQRRLRSAELAQQR